MVIQRIQSLYLLIGAILMTIFIFIPFASVENTDVIFKPTDFPVYFILNVVIALILFIAIFLYKSPRRQKTVTLVSMVLIAASAVTGGLILYGPNAPQGIVRVEWFGGVLLLVISLILALAARRGIIKDIKTLSSYDRIR